MNGHFNKRGRNQRRRQGGGGGGGNPNRALDSNGPDVRIRGTAQQIYDKYLALARDATSSGDRVRTENYLQHAEHYFRVLRAVQGPQVQSFDQQQQQQHELDEGGDQPSIGGEPRDAQRQPQAQFETEESDQAAGGESEAAPSQQNGAGDDQGREHHRQGGDFEGRRRRRRRRPREEGGQPDESEDATPEPVAG